MSASRTIAMLIALTAMLFAVSCGGAVSRRVGIESVESVSLAGLSGVDVVVTARNDLRRDIRLDSCRVAICLPSGVLARAELRGGAELARRTTAPVRLRFRLRAANLSAVGALWSRASAKKVDDVYLNIEAVVRIGGCRRKIYLPRQSLSEILRNFGGAEYGAAAGY